MISTILRASIWAAERGHLPDSLTRFGIRQLCRQRLRLEDPEDKAEVMEAFLQDMRRASVAELPEKANSQHYEVPSEFFELILGPALKYSSCYWAPATKDLATAEVLALERTCENAGIQNCQRILELGCGWGSLTLHLSSRYPQSEIVAVSNSKQQRDHIMRIAESLGLTNLQVITADVNTFQPDGFFHRVVSVEMFEHVRNHQALLKRISSWLEPQGRLLVHIFCTAGAPYPFEDEDEKDWMARNFFSGGIMPSDDLMLRYQEDLLVERQWRWSGLHYHKTLEAWLDLLDSRREEASLIFKKSGEAEPDIAVERWRIFLMACSELFAYSRGQQWYVSHYLFKKV